MHKGTITGLLLLATPFTFADDLLADPDSIQPIKSFTPPQPITPNIAQGYMLENQFDRTDRTAYFSVVNNINNGIAPLKVSAGFYNKSFYNSLFSGFRTGNYYGLFNLNYTKANDYKDAQGNKAGFGYQRFNQAAVLGFVPNELNEYRITFIHDNLEDDKQPEHQMDSVKTERYVVKLNGRIGLEDLSNTLNAEVGYRNVTRRADNYSFRTSTNNLFINLNREILDLSLKYDVDMGNWHNLIGVSYSHDEQEGKRYRHTDSADIFNAYRFADVHLDRIRLFDTLTYRFNEQHKLGLGLTYEHNQAKVKKFNATINNPLITGTYFINPQQLWQYYFGESFNGEVKQNALSAELKYDFTPTELSKYSLSLAHMERIGDNTERFNSMAAIVVLANGNYNDQQPANAIVGNPNLKVEKHNYVKFDFDLSDEFYKGYLNSLQQNGLNVGGSLMLDQVKDLIIFDRARGQQGTVLTTNSVITRNVDADLIIAKLYANYNFQRNYGLSLKALYSYGQNRTDNRALYQMRPFELQGNLDYKNYFQYGSYNLGLAVRYVAKQSRGDFDTTTGLGIDNIEAAKSKVLTDLYAGINFQDKYGIRLGVNNLFNRQYAEFISGDHVMALSPSLVYAPGRNYWLSLHATF